MPYDVAAGSTPGTYDHRGLWCERCQAQHPHYRKYKSTDPWVCTVCDLVEGKPGAACTQPGCEQCARLSVELAETAADRDRWVRRMQLLEKRIARAEGSLAGKDEPR